MARFLLSNPSTEPHRLWRMALRSTRGLINGETESPKPARRKRPKKAFRTTRLFVNHPHVLALLRLMSSLLSASPRISSIYNSHLRLLYHVYSVNRDAAQNPPERAITPLGMRVAGSSHAELHLSLILDTGVCHSHRSNTAFDREAETPGRR